MRKILQQRHTPYRKLQQKANDCVEDWTVHDRGKQPYGEIANYPKVSKYEQMSHNKPQTA